MFAAQLFAKLSAIATKATSRVNLAELEGS